LEISDLEQLTGFPGTVAAELEGIKLIIIKPKINKIAYIFLIFFSPLGLTRVIIIKLIKSAKNITSISY